MEQKKFVKFGLSTENFRLYVGMIEDEVTQFMRNDPSFRVFQMDDINEWGSFEATKVLSEITILTALLTFSDLNEAHHAASIPVPTPVPAASSTSAPLLQAPIGSTNSTAAAVPPQALAAASLPPPSDAEPPAVPPRPAPRTGVERVAEMHAVRNAVGEGDVNEVEVWEECDVMDYAQYAERLLNVSGLSL